MHRIVPSAPIRKALSVPAILKQKAQPSDKMSPGSLAKLSDKELITHLKKRFGPAKRQWQGELRYLLEAHRRYSQPGRRMPLPGRPFWGVFCPKVLGVHIRTVQRWFAEAKGRPAPKHLRDKYDSADIRHLEIVAWTAQKQAEDNPDDEAFDPIRRAIAQKPSGLFVRNGRGLLGNHYYEGNKKDGKHYHLTPAEYWADLQRRFPGLVDICPYPRPKGYDALKSAWHKFNYANIPFVTTTEPDGTRYGPTAWARKAITEQEKGNTTVIPFPMNYGFHLLLRAGAEMRSIGHVEWRAIEDGSPQPSGRGIVEFILRGKEGGQLLGATQQGNGDYPKSPCAKSKHKSGDGNFSRMKWSGNNNYATPEYLYKTLDMEFGFDYDPCPLNPNFDPTKDVDGLTTDWTGKRVFCNPPWSEISKWVTKAMTSKCLTVMVLPARTDTEWFHRLKDSAEIRLFRKRVHFLRDGVNNPTDGTLIAIVRPWMKELTATSVDPRFPQRK